MSEHVDQVDAETAQAMREDVRGRFADAGDADWVDDLTDAEVLELVDQTHEGGAAGFKDAPTDLAKMARRVGVDHRSTDAGDMEIAMGLR